MLLGSNSATSRLPAPAENGAQGAGKLGPEQYVGLQGGTMSGSQWKTPHTWTTVDINNAAHCKTTPVLSLAQLKRASTSPLTGYDACHCKTAQPLQESAQCHPQTIPGDLCPARAHSPYQWPRSWTSGGASNGHTNGHANGHQGVQAVVLWHT